MNYNESVVIDAFRIYSQLSTYGECDLKEFKEYILDDKVRGLVDLFVSEVNSTIIVTGEQLYLLPIAMASPFHISNERLKKDFLPSKALNSDIYMMYFAIIVFYGMFYDSYSTAEPVMDFVSLEGWLETMNQHIESLSAHDEEILNFAEKDMNYNWKMIIDKWSVFDDINVKAKKQDARTQSHLSFLNIVKSFLFEQGLAEDIGNSELILTEKSKDIVSKYYLDSEYNRGVLEFIYQNHDQEA